MNRRCFLFQESFSFFEHALPEYFLAKDLGSPCVRVLRTSRETILIDKEQEIAITFGVSSDQCGFT
jgi:hypothetical protein